MSDAPSPRPAPVRTVHPLRYRPEDPALIEKVRTQAIEHVRGAVYDVWSLESLSERLPYQLELERERARKVQECRTDLADSLRKLENDAASADAAVEKSDKTLQELTRVHEEALEQLKINRAKLDWLASEHLNRHPAAPPDPKIESLPEPGPEPEATGGPEKTSMFEPYERWEAASFQPPFSNGIRRAVLLGLIGVDMPIQYQIFSHFHGESFLEHALTWVLTVSVSLVLVLLPHLAGHLFRRRHLTGTARTMDWLPIAMLIPWLYLLWRLGTLRAKVMLIPPTPNGVPLTDPVTHQPYPTPAEALDISPGSIGLLFVALLLATGGIAFLIGLAQEHPLQIAHREAEKRVHDARENLNKHHQQNTAAHAEQARAHAELDAMRLTFAERLEERVTHTHLSYDQAEYSYYVALTEAAGLPALTETVSRTMTRP
ncbi:hypothetical protein ABGB12_34260 [Actinocorallia sp. B10E7]|uniref:hypothetical protein n=1 Tax=Actinocorallia sp. B10E7 TaxID=3153558 RepID=UPI00325F2234